MVYFHILLDSQPQFTGDITGPTKSDGWQRQMVRETQGNLCYLYDLMLLIMIEIKIDKITGSLCHQGKH